MTGPRSFPSPLRVLFENIERLPSVPQLYIDLMSLVNKQESSIEAIGRVISQDMAMTAMVLRMVNSAAFRLNRRVVNATEAASHLGVAKVRVLALSLGIFSQFRELSTGKLYIETVWDHSLKVATTARAIAKSEGLSKEQTDEAFAAGLLHDIGKLVLADNFSVLFQTVLKKVKRDRQRQFEAEEFCWGANHADVGGKILLNWQLPLPIAMAVYLHHHPDRAEKQVFGPLTAVHAANAIEHDLQDGPGAPENLLDLDYLNQLGVLKQLPAWRALAEQNARLAL
jgi:putative nucleotidyltransferase with HDIG domain